MTPSPTLLASPFFYTRFGVWHLKPGAPAEIITEFNEYVEADRLEDWIEEEEAIR